MAVMPKAKLARAAMISLLVLAPLAIAFNVYAAYTGGEATNRAAIVVSTAIVAGALVIAGWRRHEAEAERKAKRHQSSAG